MPQYNPGDAIESRCTRCDDVTGHVIVVLVGGEIIKVECRACGSVHKYRPPVDKAAPRPDVPRRVRQGTSRTEAIKTDQAQRAARATREPAATKSGLRGLRAAEALEKEWRDALAKSGTPRPYAMQEHFAPGESVDHPSFGSGIVKEFLPPDKIRVLFRDGLKLLRCAC